MTFTGMRVDFIPSLVPPLAATPKPEPDLGVETGEELAKVPLVSKMSILLFTALE